MKLLTKKMGRHVLLVAAASWLLIASSGCSFFAQPSQQSKLAEANGPSYTVEYHPQRAKGWQRTFPLTGPTNVSDAIERAQATRNLSKGSVSVIRNVASTNRVVAMTVVSKKKQVAPNTDYALHDGDRIVIKEEMNGPLDQMLEGMPEMF